MASIFITYGLLGFPFLFGLMEDSAVNDRKNAAGAVIGKKHSYWDWVLLGFSISLVIFVLRYIRATIKWKETKQYILKKNIFKKCIFKIHTCPTYIYMSNIYTSSTYIQYVYAYVDIGVVYIMI